jgi:hypothetical protein
MTPASSFGFARRWVIYFVKRFLLISVSELRRDGDPEISGA